MSLPAASPQPIRPATAADVRAIEALIQQAFAEYIPRLRGERPGRMRDDHVSLVARGAVEVLDDEAGLLGVLVMLAREDHLLLHTVAVRPDRQGSGLSQQLFRHAEEYARLAGFQEMRLYTAEVMVESVALYRRCGWLEYARAAPTGIPRIYMRKRV